MFTHAWRNCQKCKKKYFVSSSSDLAGKIVETYFMGLRKISEKHASNAAFVCAICEGTYKPGNGMPISAKRIESKKQEKKSPSKPTSKPASKPPSKAKKKGKSK